MDSKVPRRLYTLREINKYFSLEYQTLKNIWMTNGGQADVTADNGKKYHAKYNSGKLNGLGWNGFIELKRVYE